MSSSGKDSIDTRYMDKVVSNIGDLGLHVEDLSKTISQNAAMTKAYEDATKRFEKSEKTFEDAVKMFKAITDAYKKVLKVDYNIDATTKANASLELFGKKLAEAVMILGDFEKYKGRFKTGIDNFFGTGVFESMRDETRGVKKNNLMFKGTLDNEKLKGIYNDFINKLGIKIDSAQYKLLSLGREMKRDAKKYMDSFGKSLLEGLEKSKWVGGALHDGLRLLGLLGAQFMSRFGQLGKVIGGAFYVAMEVAGPYIVDLFLRGLSRALPAILKGAWKVGSALGWGNVAGVAAGATGAYFAFKAAEDSDRKNMEGNAAAYRVGGTIMGAGAAAMGGAAVATGVSTVATAAGASGIAAGASGIAAALGPIGLILLGIGGAVAGIAFLYKKHKEKEMEHYYGTKEYYERVIQGLNDLSKEEKAIMGLQGTAQGPTELSPRNDEYVEYGSGKTKLKVSKRDKSILNLHELSQKEASEALKAYEAADPTGFNSVYEWVDADHANFKSFKTDAVKFDEKGNKIAVLGKKGQSRELDEFRTFMAQYLIRQGKEREEAWSIANSYKLSSGKATGSNEVHTPGREDTQFKTHFDRYGRVIDVTGDYMNDLGKGTLKAFYENRGYKVKIEQKGEGKSTGVHAHIAPAKNVMPMAAQLNAEDYDKKQEANVIAVGNILKSVDEEKYNKINKGLAQLGQEPGNEYRLELRAKDLYARNSLYTNALADKGITLQEVGDTGAKVFSRVDQSSGEREFAFIDATDDAGNVTWLQMDSAIAALSKLGGAPY